MRRRDLLAVAAAVVCVVGLGSQSYWFDDSYTYHLLQEDVAVLFAGIPDTESSPPLYYLCAWFWVYAITLTRPEPDVAREPDGYVLVRERRTATYVLQEFRRDDPRPVEAAAFYPARAAEAAFIP